MNSAIQDYWQNVLGLNWLVVPGDLELETPKVPVLFDGELNEAEADLWEKMMAAIKVGQFVRVGEALAWPASANLGLAFGVGVPGEITSMNGRRFISTYSPRRLLEEPQLKRLAWEHLKLFMRERGEVTR